MAVQAAFKQPCPSCEALVPIKSANLVGKKIDCPKCKYRFLVEEPGKPEAPAEEDAPAMDEAEMEALTKGKAGPVSGGKKTNGKPAKKARGAGAAGQGDEASDAGASPVADAPGSPGKKKEALSQKLKLGLGLGAIGLVVLCVAGFSILGGKKADPASGPFAINPDLPKAEDPPDKDKDKKEEPKRPEPPVKEGHAPAGPQLTNLLPPDSEHVLHVFFKNIFNDTSMLERIAFGPGGFVENEFNGKLGVPVLAIDDLIRAEKFSFPAWSFTVLHTRRPVSESGLAKALGLQQAPSSINNQSYYISRKRDPWLEQFGQLSFGAPNYLRQFRQRPKPSGSAANADLPLLVRFHDPQTLIFADQAPMVAFLEALGQFKYQNGPVANAPGSEPKTPAANPPLGVNPPTGKQFPGGFPLPKGGVQPPGGPLPGGPVGNSPGSQLQPQGAQAPGGFPPGGAQPPGGFPMPPGGGKLPGGFPNPGGTPGPVGNPPGFDAAPPKAQQPSTRLPARSTYRTLNYNLKAMLDRMEDVNSKDLLFFSMATDMTAARLSIKDPEWPDRVLWQFRQVWDVANLLNEKKSRIRHLGASLFQKDTQASGPAFYRFKNELVCFGNLDAREIYTDLWDKGAPELARVLNQLLDIKVELPRAGNAPGEPERKQAPPQPGDQQPAFPGGPAGVNPPKEAPPKPKTEEHASRIMMVGHDATVEFLLDLVLEGNGPTKLSNAASLMVLGLKNELDLAAARSAAATISYRHALGKAVGALPKAGLTERGVPPEFYPPGVFRRNTSLRSAREPGNRVSWMAGLLPFLGHENLASRINYDLSWRDPGNWLAARTIVPEFLDPMYPVHSFYVQNPDMPFEAAATHFVGIAGIGLDAADYPNHPDFDHKRGVLGYDGSRGLREVKENRGLSNTLLLIQVPHDGAVGATPWMAGGGSTLRGVPEKNSIAPFVLTTDREGHILHNGKRGTYAVMTDGSVRFIDANISDEVFKAMCTVKGPPLDLDKNEWAAIVPEPKAEVKPPTREGPKPDPKADPPALVKKEGKDKSPLEDPIKTKIKTSQLKRIGLAYHSCLDAKKPPAKVEELAPYYENDAQLTDAIRKGDLVIFWNVQLLKLTAGTSNTVLGYEKDAPARGGLVLMADGSVRRMTAAEFKAAAKPK